MRERDKGAPGLELIEPHRKAHSYLIVEHAGEFAGQEPLTLGQ